MEDLNYHHLKYFWAVARSETLTSAAQKPWPHAPNAQHSDQGPGKQRGAKSFFAFGQKTCSD